MNIVKYFFILLVGTLLFSSISCKKQQVRTDHPVPSTPVNLTVNLDNPSNIRLHTPGGYVYLQGGFKGIVVVNFDSETYYAFDRGCPYHPYAECAQITADESGLYFRCGHYEGEDFVACCESEYGQQGNTLNGPSQHPLRQYSTYKEGSILTIAN